MEGRQLPPWEGLAWWEGLCRDEGDPSVSSFELQSQRLKKGDTEREREQECKLVPHMTYFRSPCGPCVLGRPWEQCWVLSLNASGCLLFSGLPHLSAYQLFTEHLLCAEP